MYFLRERVADTFSGRLLGYLNSSRSVNISLEWVVFETLFQPFNVTKFDQNYPKI